MEGASVIGRAVALRTSSGSEPRIEHLGGYNHIDTFLDALRCRDLSPRKISVKVSLEALKKEGVQLRGATALNLGVNIPNRNTILNVQSPHLPRISMCLQRVLPASCQCISSVPHAPHSPPAQPRSAPQKLPSRPCKAKLLQDCESETIVE